MEAALWILIPVAILSAIGILILLIRRAPEQDTKVLRDALSDEFRNSRQESGAAAKLLRDEVTENQNRFSEAISGSVKQFSEALEKRFDQTKKDITQLTESNENRLERLRVSTDATLKQNQEATDKALKEFADTVRIKLDAVNEEIRRLSETNTTKIETLRTSIESKLKDLQEGNEKKLEQMRQTVDEKLQNTLEKRLGESFNLVSERLEAVQKGLGEMQNLAVGVGDLRKVLTNVKTRGTWGEVQLGAILEQILSPEQYEKNVRVRPDSNEQVEYAIKFPGPSADVDAPVWLPIDSKFPVEDYQRLVEAADKGEEEQVKLIVASLIKSFTNSAKEISQKYINPPNTIDCAIMFLPTEGLYAEALRQPGFVEQLQHDHRIIVAGPTTLVATLISLKMGFRTLAIEKRSSEVWHILAAVKTEFEKFGDVLQKLKNQLSTASNTIDAAETRTRAMERKLRAVEKMPDIESSKLLGIAIPEEETPKESP